jgi:hypothetical protein
MMKSREWIVAHKDHQDEECLIWPYSRCKKSGAGWSYMNGKSVLAHRLMCRAAHGEPPFPDAVAAHNCGMGHEGCVNPGHLEWKTQHANIFDKIDHGTMPRGQEAWNAKLTNEQALAFYADPRSAKEIAKDHPGIVWQTIQNLKIGKSWSWLTGHENTTPSSAKVDTGRVFKDFDPEQPRAPIKTIPKPHKFTEEQILAMYRDTRRGAEIARAYGASPAYVCLLRQGKVAAHITGHKSEAA